MRAAIKVEFAKLRGKRVWIIIAALLAAQLMWMAWSVSRMNEHLISQGWMFCLYQLSAINTIIMPISAAVLASRLSDIEHKGQTFKLLNTVMHTKNLFIAKLLIGSVYILSAIALQVIFIILIGHIYGFTGRLPIVRFLCFYIFTLSVSMTLLLLQQILSLLLKNQVIPFIVGIAGSLIGLFSLFFPATINRLILWGYFGVLTQVSLGSWDTTTRIATYYYTDINWSGFATIIVVFFMLYFAGQMLWIRKEA